MTSYRFGFDVGTNSLGWAVLEVDQKGNPLGLLDAGVRIFPEGRDAKTKETLKASRRLARSASRRRDRFIRRRTDLLAALTDAGLFPQDPAVRRALQDKNPLELRAKALSEKLDPFDIGRALFHLNQRRGFQSNRKDRSEEVTSGKVSNSVGKLLQDMGLLEPPLDKETYKSLPKEEKKFERQRQAEDRAKPSRPLRRIKPEATARFYMNA
ncbi:MAG: type II CRISPR RNA-guided endonuclease Cas9 [Pseudomonadota bacterium]